MNRLSKAIKGGDPVNINVTIQEVRIQSIISYLLCNVGQEINVDILKHLIDRLPVWYIDDYKYVPDYVNIVCSASLDNLKIILEHPTFAPPPVINRYIDKTTPDAFSLLIASPKFGSDGETLDYLLRHNHPDKIQAFLASNKVIVPPPEKVAKLATSYSGHRYSLSLVLADPRFDLAKLEMSFFKTCLNYNDAFFLDVLKRRVPDKINPLIAKKEEQARMQELHRPNLFN